jgi:hypothetical protein
LVIIPAPDDDDDECGAVRGMRIGRGTEELGENLRQYRFVHHKSHMTWLGIKSGPRRWEASN